MPDGMWGEYSLPNYRAEALLRPGNAKPSEPPPAKHSRDELIDHLRRGQLDSVRKFRNNWRKGYPTEWEYVVEFGSWQAAKEAAFGREPRRFSEFTEGYSIKAVLDFELWSYRSYCEARRRSPDIIPSHHRIRTLFGSYTGLKKAAMRANVEIAVNSYLALGRRLGKVPSLRECDRHGVDISGAIEIFGTKKKLDRSLEGWRRKSEKQG